MKSKHKTAEEYQIECTFLHLNKLKKQNDFIKSLQKFWELKGYLTEKQKMALFKYFNKITGN